MRVVHRQCLEKNGIETIGYEMIPTQPDTHYHCIVCRHDFSKEYIMEHSGEFLKKCDDVKFIEFDASVFNFPKRGKR